jgi:hypothetical protein
MAEGTQGWEQGRALLTTHKRRDHQHRGDDKGRAGLDERRDEPPCSCTARDLGGSLEALVGNAELCDECTDPCTEDRAPATVPMIGRIGVPTTAPINAPTIEPIAADREPPVFFAPTAEAMTSPISARMAIPAAMPMVHQSNIPCCQKLNATAVASMSHTPGSVTTASPTPRRQTRTMMEAAR